MGRNFLRGKKRSERMKKFYHNYVAKNIPFHILATVSVAMLIASWIWPPTAIIDSSVLAASGELIGWGALYTLLRAVEKGKTASVSHNGTTITVGEKEEEHGTEVEEEI